MYVGYVRVCLHVNIKDLRLLLFDFDSRY